MYGLPQATELNKQIPKKSIYARFKMNTTVKENFDADIHKLAIVAEISPATTNIAAGESVAAFYVIQVSLRKAGFDSKNIILLSRLIDQNLLFALEHEGKVCLAVFRNRLLQSGWISLEEISIRLLGLNLDSVWENIIIQIGGVKVEEGNTLDEQLVIDEKRVKLRRKIELLERKARGQKQPRKKFELVQEVRRLKEELGDANEC